MAVATTGLGRDGQRQDIAPIGEHSHEAMREAGYYDGDIQVMRLQDG